MELQRISWNLSSYEIVTCVMHAPISNDFIFVSRTHCTSFPFHQSPYAQVAISFNIFILFRNTANTYSLSANERGKNENIASIHIKRNVSTQTSERVRTRYMAEHLHNRGFRCVFNVCHFYGLQVVAVCARRFFETNWMTVYSQTANLNIWQQWNEWMNGCAFFIGDALSSEHISTVIIIADLW